MHAMMYRTLPLPAKPPTKDFPIKLEIQPAIAAGCPAPRGSESIRHHRWMRSIEFLQHGIILKLKTVVHELLGLFGRYVVSMVDRHLFSFLSPASFWGPSPTHSERLARPMEQSIPSVRSGDTAASP